MAKSTDIDFAQIPLDVPLGELALSTNGTQLFAAFAAKNRDKTLREAVVARSGAAGPTVAGTPDDVAAQLGELMAEVGGDGFLIGSDGVTRRQIAEITDGLVPELQRRGLTRAGYTRSTLRDNLLEF
jgi:alkanesulfonate monooxygenase SsuD/methylene tetrahydromethanopterin reductase-like flavin-dependent oxidoreductase (luciferase family)